MGARRVLPHGARAAKHAIAQYFLTLASARVHNEARSHADRTQPKDQSLCHGPVLNRGKLLPPALTRPFLGETLAAKPCPTDVFSAWPP
jgi:hypothetical protein